MAHQHPDQVITLVLGEPPAMSLLEGNKQNSKDVDTIRENAFEPVQNAIRRGEKETCDVSALGIDRMCLR